MTMPTPPRKTFHFLNWPQVLTCLVFGLLWGTVPGVYQRWRARREYDLRYSTILELPSTISRPKAFLQRMPGVVGKALWIDFYLPNPDEYDQLTAWFVKHDGFTESGTPNPSFQRVAGTWEAERGSQSLILSRDAGSGWVHITLGHKMSPKEAEKDLASYPWQSEMQSLQKHRAE